MKKKLALVLALLMLAALLTGCGGNAKSKAAYDTAAVAMPAAAPAMPMEAKAESGYGGYNDYDYAMTEEEVYYEAPAEPMEAPAPLPELTGGNTIPEGVKLIYRADVSLESTAFDAAVEAIRTLTESCGGYYENSSLDNYSSYRYAWYTIRVPAEQFEHFCATVAEIGAGGETFQLNNISRSAEDVSEYYYDTESRLATQKTKLARLQKLLSEAENMTDIITIESAISDTEWQIENLTGTLRHYDSLVGYSTICVNISEVYQLSEIEEPAIGFGAKLTAAFKSGCSNFVYGLERTALRIARGWVGWLIFIVIVLVVMLVIVRIVRRSKVKAAEREARRAEAREKHSMPKAQPRQPESTGEKAPEE